MLEKHLSFPDRPVSLLADDELVQRPSHRGSAPVDYEARPFLFSSKNSKGILA
jgi:hypothetical protein